MMVAMTKLTPAIAPALADLPYLPIASLTPLQGNLKDLSAREYKKLKKSLLEFGIMVPFFVWRQTNKLIDGHQRLRLFEKEGWLIDVPVVFIDAETEDEARRKLLVVSSQYGKVTQEGWDEFTFGLDADWLAQTVQFDALPFVFGESEEPPDFSPVDVSEQGRLDQKAAVVCPHCGAEFVPE